MTIIVSSGTADDMETQQIGQFTPTAGLHIVTQNDN